MSVLSSTLVLADDSDSAAREDVFIVSDFLKFLFSVLFLFVCCLSLMLYINKFAAFCVTQIMRYFVLPKHTNFHVRGFHVAPLRARIFFQQVFLANENYSIRIVDGYFTVALWNSWLRDVRWTRVHDYMFSPDLIGMRCRVMVSFKNVKGTIREVDLERQKITVELDDGPSWSDEDADDEEDVEEAEMASRESDTTSTDTASSSHAAGSDQPDDEVREAVVGLDDGVADHLNRPFETGGVPFGSFGRTTTESRSSMRAHATMVSSRARRSKSGQHAHGARGPGRGSMPSGTTSVRFTNRRSAAAASGAQSGGGSAGEKVLKVYDMSDVSVRNRPGRCQLHLNGMRVCLFNATGKYNDLKNPKAADRDKEKVRDDVSPHVRRLQRFFRRNRKDATDLDGEHTDAARERAREEAFKIQQHQLKHKSFTQKLFDIIGCIEIETSVSSIDMGGLGSSHPYFLHTAFHTGEGRIYLTQSGVPNIDLYRLVVELTLQQVDMRMVPMDNKLTKTQLMRNPTLLERTHLLFRGTAERHHNRQSSFVESSVVSEAGEIPDLIRDFGIILDGKDRSDVHMVYFRDAPNIYAGEDVVRGKVPTSSVEVLLDAQRLRYGPWLEYCRMQLWNFFLPPNFRPLQVMDFEVGKPRPVCGFDMFVEFVTNTTIEVPFKRRAPAPSPPFGIRDSKRKGMLSATIGKGSQYIQPAFFLLKGEKKQRLEALFLGKNVDVRANAVLDRDNVQFCTAETVQFFLDREDDIIWNGRKRWNIITHLFNVETYFYMSYVDFFLDLLNDWQFSQNMYHNVPLTTETFNTHQRAIRDFIPNVKRFEVFADKLALHVNVNTHNVIYSENPNDPDQNIIATLRARSGSFAMVLPSDQYQLAAENEVVRPLEAHADDVEVFLSLPKLHPLSAISSSEIRWAYARSMDVRGSFTCIIPCQSRPIPTDNLNPQTGRTRFRNYLNLEVDFTHMEGRLMGQHIKGLVNALENLFLDNTLPIAPDELFWLLAKLQSHVALGKNKRKEFKQFLETKQPAGNDLEVAVSVTLRDIDAVVCIGQGRRDPGLNVATSLLNFSYVKQFAVTDTCVTISPITARFIDERGHILHSPTAFLCVGDIAVSLVKHFGPMPFKPKVHESMDVKVQGVSLSANVEHLMRLAQMVQTLVEHLKAEDPVMEAEVNEAHSVAEYAADQLAPQSPSPQYGLRRRQHTNDARTMGALHGEGSTDVEPAAAEPNAGQSVGASSPQPALQAYEEKDFVARRMQGTFFEQQSSDSVSQSCGTAQAPFSLGFADEVPYAVAQEYAAFMEEMHAADEASKDYGIFCTLISIGVVEGAAQVGDAGVLTLCLPWGATVATTTLNDGNSNNRLSVAAREVSVRALVPRELEAVDAKSNDASNPRLSPAPLLADVNADVLGQYAKYLEVFLVQTSVCLRHYTAYPFDGSLDMHRKKQRQFVRDNDYEQLICFAFENPGTTTRTPPTEGRQKSPQRSPTTTTVPQCDDAAATPLPPPTARHAQATPTSSAMSPARPSLAPSQDPPTLARKGKEVPRGAAHLAPETEFSSPAFGVARPVDAFAQAVANVSGSGSPLFSTQNDRNAGRVGAAAVAGGGGPVDAHSGDCSATISSLNGSSDDDGLRSLRSENNSRSRSMRAADQWKRRDGDRSAGSRSGSGDTTVHVPGVGAGAVLSSLSSSVTDTFAHGDGGIFADDGVDHNDVDCGADAAAVFATCRSVSSDLNSSDSSSMFDERMRFEDFEIGVDDSGDHMRDTLSGSGSSRTEEGDAHSDAQHAKKHTSEGPSAGAAARRKSARLTAVGFEQRFEHQFFCAYFRSSPLSHDAETHSLLDFTTMRASRTAPHREWVHGNAPLPTTSFVLYSVPTGFPDYVFAEQFMQTHYRHESDVYNWANRQANNSQRSAHQSTTKHLHVEVMEPVQVLLSRQLLCLMEAAVDTVDGIQQQLVPVVKQESTAYSQDRSGTDFLGVQDQVRRRNAAAFFRPQRKTNKSHARTQQKRWLTEDRIVTTMIPCVEIKFLSGLPVPEENRPASGRHGVSVPSASLPYGVYCSTLALRDVELIMAKDRPPAGVVESPADATRKMSASVSVTSVAFIVQIEQEPLPRQGNLSVTIPNLPYDDLKDTIGVFYITDVQARVKQDTVRGANRGACSIAIGTIALHSTRELVDYLRLSAKVLLAHTERIAAKITDAAQSFGAAAAAAPRSNLAGARAGRQRRSLFTQPQPSALIVDRTRTLQGKCRLSCLYLCMIDTRRQGDCIVVDTTHPSHMRIAKVSTNFVLVSPNRRPGQPECVHLTTTGEIGSLTTRVYPYVLHSLSLREDRTDWRTLYADSPSFPVASAATAGTGAADDGGHRVSFEEVSTAPISRTPTQAPIPSGTPKPLQATPTTRAAAEGRPVPTTVKKQWVYNFAFTLRALDAVVAHSNVNYAQLRGTNLTGGAESRLEPMRSRECVQMEALTESISPRLKERLRFLAHKARQRAGRSRYAAPPSTTAQLQLYSTASFFTQTLVARYVVDPVLHNAPSAAAESSKGTPSAVPPFSPLPTEEVAEVIVAAIDGISASCHFSDQYDILGQQYDVHAIVDKVVITAPHHTHTEQMISPQLVQFITSWRRAAKKVQASVGGGTGGGGGLGGSRPASAGGGMSVLGRSLASPTAQSEGPAADARIPKPPRNGAAVIHVQVKQMESTLGLPQGIQQRFLLPELCIFFRASSNERVSLKLHAHPFSIMNKTTTPESYCVTLPNIFLVYAHDAHKMTSSLMMEPVSITITPHFINHALLAYEKLTLSVGALVSTNVPLDEHGNVALHAPSPLAPLGERSVPGGSVGTGAGRVSIKRGRRCSFLFLWQGFRFSYLTSMSNLRFSLRKLNAIGESSQVETRKTLEWTINVTGAQFALVDRHYHDKCDRGSASMAVRESQQRSAATGSNGTTSREGYSARTQPHPPMSQRRAGRPGDAQSTTSTIPSATVPATEDATVRAGHGAMAGEAARIDPLAGYVWGSVELNFALSGGKTDRETVKSALMSTSFGAYTEEMQTALMSKLGVTNAWWNLAVSSPLVLVRIGLVPLLDRCFEETKRDISFMKQVSMEESRNLQVRLNRHRTFHKLQKEKRRYEALINRNRHEQIEQLRRMTGQVALDLQRRRAGLSQGRGWDSTMPDLDVSTTHRFVATVTNFMVILPFGDNAFRSVLDELPEAFSCHRTEKHMHTVNCLDRRRFLPTVAFKTKIESTSFICEMTSTKSLQLISSPTAREATSSQPPQTPISPLPDGPAGAVVATSKFVGRFLATDTMLYFSPGTPVNTANGVASLRALSRQPFLLGGDGNLAGSDVAEYHCARNTIHITTVDAPVHIKFTREKTSVAVMLDMSGPRVRLSPHFVTLMMELGREFPTRRLQLQALDTSSGTFVGADGSTVNKSPPSSPPLASTGPQGTSVSDMDTSEKHMTVDVSARLEAGDISLFSYGVDDDTDGMGTNTETPTAAKNSSVGESVFRRGQFPVRVLRSNGNTGDRFPSASTPRSTEFLMPGAGGQPVPLSSPRAKSATATRTLPTADRRQRSWPGGAAPSTAVSGATEESMNCVLRIPLPSVLVQVLVRRSNLADEDDIATVRADIHAGVIELGPSLGIVAREIEQTAAMHVQNVIERRKNLVALIQELEKVAVQSHVVLLMPMHELLLPVPRAYASTVLSDRTQRMASLHRRSRTADGTSPRAASTRDRPEAGDANDDVAESLTEENRKRYHFVTDVQVTLSDFRLVFSVEPFASTAFTVFLGERGSVDVLCRVVKTYRHRLDPLPYVTKDATRAIVVNVRRLRAECQTKLEVKSLEIILPEAELVLSMREGTVGSVQSVAVNFPFNVEGSLPNLTLRMQHMAQAFMVTKIWTRIGRETISSVSSLMKKSAEIRSEAKALARRLGEDASRPVDLGTDKRVMVVAYLSHGVASVDMGSGNAHQLLFGAIRLAVERCARTSGSMTYLLKTHVESLQMRSEGVLSGLAALNTVALQTFLILNAEDSEEFLRSQDERTFRGIAIVQRLHVSFKERQLKDIFECRVGDLTCNVMDGIGVDNYTTSDLDVSLAHGMLGVTPSTVPAVLTVLRSISTVVADQQALASERISAAVKTALKSAQNGSKVPRRCTSSVPSIPEPVFSWAARTRRDSEDTNFSAASSSTKPQPESSSPLSDSVSVSARHRYIAYLGNRIPRIPCGQLTVALEDTQLLLGAISSGQAATGCVVASFTRALFSFAETPCQDYTAVKKVLIVETHNAELYRPGPTKVVVLGFQGSNHFEFYTQQVLGQGSVGFTLTLRQTHPWTGNPRFRDFEEMITLVKSFTDRRNVKAFKQFGHSDMIFSVEPPNDTDESVALRRVSPSAPRASPGFESKSPTTRNGSPAGSASKRVAKIAIVSEKAVEDDVRILKALRASKFSPQLRFGGDVSVNTEVILNWLGITEKMLPVVLNSQLCDKLELVLYTISANTSERVRLTRDPNIGLPSSNDEESQVSSPRPTAPAARGVPQQSSA